MAITESGRQIVFNCQVPRAITTDSVSSLRVKSDLERYDEPLSYWNVQGELLGIALPIVFYPDYYYFTSDTGIVYLDNDLKRLTGMMDNVQLDQRQIEKILLRERCDSDATPIEGIKRLGGYSFYIFTKNGVEKHPILMSEFIERSDQDSYEVFKMQLNKTIETIYDQNRNKKNYLLMSGGADSRLLFLLLLKKEIPFEVRTVLNIPTTHGGNFNDAVKAQEVCEAACVKCRVNLFDFNTANIEIMHEAPKAMPTCVHDWVGFYYALLDIDNGSIVWTGQNADAFYNFSPTEKFSFSPHGIAQWFKRFYLSEAYLESLPDINGKAGLTSKLLARCGLMMFSLYFRGEKLSLPKSFLELEQRFSNSDDFLILRESDNLKEDKSVLRKTLQLNCSEAFNDLLRVKVDHCHGGHVQAINSAAELKGSNAVFPYSSCRMMSWFESFPRGWADVNRPKRFIYKYIDELSQEFGSRLTNFDPPKKDTSFAQKVTIKSLYGYFKELLESQFGRSLIKESKIPEDSIGLFPDDMRKYEYILRHWWIEKLRELYIE